MGEPLAKTLRCDIHHGVEINVAKIIAAFCCDDEVQDTSLTRGITHRSCIGQDVL